jgi:hypothetical protein
MADSDNTCSTEKLTFALGIGVVWNAIEYYFYRIIHNYFLRSSLGFYGKEAAKEVR